MAFIGTPPTTKARLPSVAGAGLPRSVPALYVVPLCRMYAL